MINKVRYDIENDKVNKKIVLLTDIHYYQAKDMKKLNEILEALKEDKIDYICLGGDNIDVGRIKDPNLFLDWIRSLAKLSKVIISLGGHDLVRQKKDLTYYYNEEFYAELKKIDNVHLLDNEVYEERSIRFIGLTLPVDYYYKYHENINYFKRYVNHLFDAYPTKYNILMSHTPVPFTTLKDYQEIKLMANVPLVLSGHTHAGITPKFLRKLFHGVGIFSPHKGRLFVKESYGLVKRDNTKIIISSGVTKASHTNKFHFLDNLFDHEITYINLYKPSKKGSPKS